MVRNASNLHALKLLVATTFLIFLSHSYAGAQANFDSQTSGTWNAPATWSLVSGTDADGIPDANDNATVKSGHVVTIGNANRNCANLTVDAGGTVHVDNTGNIRINANPGSAIVNGSVIMSSSGNLQETGTGTRSLLLNNGGRVTISGTAAFPAFDTYACDPNSTVEFSGSGNQNVRSGIVYGNLSLSGGGKKTVAPLPADTAFRSNGTLTIGSGVTFDVSTNILYARFYGNVQIDGILDASVGTVVVEMHGSLWTNNGTFRCSVTPGFGWQPVTTFFGTQIMGSTTTQKFFDVRFEGSNTAFASIDSARNIEIRPGAMLDGGTSNTHKLTGSWLNNGTYNCNTATVALIGTASQSVTGSVFNNLVINNPAGATLNGDVTISSGGTLTLTNGNLTTGAYALHIANPGASALSIGSGRIFGRVSRAIAVGATAPYPFLSTNAFITPNGVNNPTTITMAEFPNANPPNLGPTADTSKIVKRYYNITQTGAGTGFDFTMRLPYLQSEARGIEATYALFRDDGSGWLNMGSAIVDVANNYVEQSSLTGFSNWAIAEGDAALPIQLAYLTANVVQNTTDVRLVWGTITETNNYGFVVQRRNSNESVYADLPNSFIPGHGTTTEPQQYSWTHTNVELGSYFYRLKQIDLDGTTHYSDGVEVTVSTPTSVEETMPRSFNLEQNYPNPFNPSTAIGFSVDERTLVTLTIFDLLGQKIATLFSAVAMPGQRYEVWFDGSGLPNGIYVSRLESASKSVLRKMILLK